MMYKAALSGPPFFILPSPLGDGEKQFHQLGLWPK